MCAFERKEYDFGKFEKVIYEYDAAIKNGQVHQ